MNNNNRSVSLFISDPKVFDCSNCSQTLTIPVFQCDNGHIVCANCYSEIRNKCYKCSLRIKRCKGIENILQSMQLPCPNEKHGCRKRLSYFGKQKHEECFYEPCCCPLLGCDFVASSEVLYKHFRHKHEDSQIKFSYGHSFVLSLTSNDETIVLQEKNDDKLFILNNSTMLMGNKVNICCISPNSSKFEYSYNILARSPISQLNFQSLAKNVQQVTLANLSSEFLVIPVGSSELLKLKICITPNNCKVGMQIFVRSIVNNKWLILDVKSSDTIGNVKEKIIDKDNMDIPVHQLRLTFQSKSLDDKLTIADYNIQENSSLHLAARMSLGTR